MIEFIYRLFVCFIYFSLSLSFFLFRLSLVSFGMCSHIIEPSKPFDTFGLCVTQFAVFWIVMWTTRCPSRTHTKKVSNSSADFIQFKLIDLYSMYKKYEDLHSPTKHAEWKRVNSPFCFCSSRVNPTAYCLFQFQMYTYGIVSIRLFPSSLKLPPIINTTIEISLSSLQPHKCWFFARYTSARWVEWNNRRRATYTCNRIDKASTIYDR